MEKLRKVSLVLAIFLIIFLGITTTVNAATLTLKTTADKKDLKVGETVTVTVDWQEGMQAADFILNYDSSKVEYQSSSIGDDYLTNDSANGKVKIVWISLNDKDMTKMTFTFKTKAQGTVKFSSKIDGGFATGEMVQPDSYDVTTYAEVTIKNENTGTQTPGAGESQTPEQDKPTIDEIIDKIEEEKEKENELASGNVTVGGTTSNTTTQNKNENTTNKAPTVIPHAGTGMNFFIVIVTLGIITMFAYIQIKRYKEI